MIKINEFVCNLNGGIFVRRVSEHNSGLNFAAN